MTVSARGEIGTDRLEPAAIAGVMSREVANFRTFWKATTFSSLLEPTIYLLAFGLGLGATIVDQRRRDRLRRVRRHRDGRDRGDLRQRAAGDVRHLRQAPLPAHLRRDPRRAGRRRGAGHRRDAVDRPARRLLRLLPAARRDRASASTRRRGCCWCRSSASSPRSASPASGSRSPATVAEDRPVQLRDHARRSPRCSWSPGPSSRSTSCPRASRSLAQLNPLYQLVELVRGAAFGFETVDVLRVLALAAFAVAMWRLAVRQLTRRLVD